MTDDDRKRTLVRAFDDVPTLTEPSSTPGVDLSPTSQSQGPRYAVRSVLGRGGMGEVRLCRDARIGRDVAVKVAPAGERFLREARIQAQLEHPAIVPVHDLEILEDGTALLVMKRVRGQTLAQVAAEGTLPLRKLLEAFNAVCLAVHFAHSRGVVHRDIKPQNIMLGDFGEVYVLDWGIAKLIGEKDDDDMGERIASTGVHTEVGNVLGTPGYFAPEQLDANLGEISARTDVYALGCVLFELLAHRSFIATRDPVEIAVITLNGSASPRPSTWVATVPPVLDDVCAKALARDPSARFESARALQEAVDRYLAGEQDQERRLDLSRAHTARADEAVALALDDATRKIALHELGSALALDPENVGARRSLLRLLTSPPAAVPDEVKRGLAEDDAETVRVGARATAFANLMLLPFLPFAYLLGVRDPLVFGVGAVLSVGAAGIALLNSRQRKPTLFMQYLSFAIIMLLYVALTRIVGPLMLVPGLAVGLVSTLQTHPNLRFGQTALVSSIAMFTIVFVIEGLGLISPSYVIVDEGILVHSNVLALGRGALVFLAAATIVNLLVPSLFARRVRKALSDAELKLRLQAWQLEQLVGR